MRTVITGATGFAGRHLAELVGRQGAEVVGFARRTPPDEVPGVAELRTVDLLERDAVDAAIRDVRPEVVFHLAADASVASSWRDPRGTIDRNLDTTANLLDAVKRHASDARVVAVGSGEEYGAVPEDRLPVLEEEPARPRNPYAASKAIGDLFAGFYADAHGLDVIRTRAFNHAGPGQPRPFVVASLAQQIAAAELAGDDRVVVTTGNAAVRRDFTDVRDVVRAYWLLVEHGQPGVYNICSGRSVPITAILAGLGSHSRLTVEHRTDPSLVRENDVMDIRGSHARLTNDTGWTPEIPLERTLGDTLEWWRQQERENGTK
jgi:GDP-4-dehydro-6-deoxy-D-mannose reductase